MNCLDPRQFLLSSFYMDPTTNSLLMANLAANGSSAASALKRSDKMTSFNISQLLSSSTSSDTSSRVDDDGPDSSTESDHLHTSSDDVLQLMTSTSAEDESTSSSRRASPSESSTSPTTGAIKKARKARTIFTDKQLQELETTFEKQKYLSVQDRMELANKMGLSDTQVKTWYQNRRTKWKRQSSVGMDLLSDASNLAAVQQLFRSNPLWAAGYLSNLSPFLVGQSTMPVVRPLAGLPMTNSDTPPLTSTSANSTPSSLSNSPAALLNNAHAHFQQSQQSSSVMPALPLNSAASTSVDLQQIIASNQKFPSGSNNLSNHLPFLISPSNLSSSTLLTGSECSLSDKNA